MQIAASATLPRRIGFALVAAVAAAVLIVACDSTPAPKTGKVDSAFIFAADAACGPFLDQAQAKVFPYPSFAPTDPLVTQLPSAGEFYDSLPINHEEVTLLNAMGTPKKGLATWAAFVAVVSQQQALVTQQIKAATDSDKAGFVATVNQIAALAPKIDAAAADVGFATDSNCAQLFG